MEATTGIIILTAGNSSRLGQPKQLLKYKGNTLLRNTITQVKLVPNSIIVVVTGAYKQQIVEELAFAEVNVVDNPHWQDGMASSISAGLSKLRVLSPNIETCIFTVCDQPYLSAEIFTRMLALHSECKKGIVASAYADTLGVPMLFNRKYFDVLVNLTGQDGAKKLLQNYKEDVMSVPFKNGHIDIDTIDDYKKLINS